MSPLPLAVVIPTWNGRDRIADCLRSLLPLDPAEIVVVDNASTDGTPEIMERLGAPARIIRHQENRGFAAACNAGARATGAPFVLFLNQDAAIIPTGITSLLEVLKASPRAAAAGGRIENPDGTLQPSMGPRPHPLRIVLDRIPGLRMVLPTHVYRHPRYYATARQPAWLTGACLLVRRAAFNDVGLFDERYFMYTEDLDWCTRARKRGWTLQYLPVRTAIHADDGRRPDRAPQKARWMREGLHRYFETHGTPGQARLFGILLAAEGARKIPNTTDR